MILWIVLFLGIITASFYLALRSMRSYQEKPEHFSYPYALYLIQNPRHLTADTLQKLYQALLPKRALISFERLSKGSRQALVVFGPVPIMEPFIGDLGLLELEDYTAQTNPQQVQALEFGSAQKSGEFQTDQVLTHLAEELQSNEEVWLQMTLQPLTPGLEVMAQKVIRSMSSETYHIAATRLQKMSKSEKPASNVEKWSASIRAMVVSPEPQRKESLAQKLAHSLHNMGLIRLPQKFTSAEMLKQYRQRHMLGGSAVTLIDHPSLRLLLHPEPNQMHHPSN